MRYFLRRTIGSWIYRLFGIRSRFASLYWIIHTNWIARCVYVAAELDLAEKLKQPQTLETLAEECQVSPIALGKVLRLLAAFEVFQRQSDGRWALARHGYSLLDESATGMKYWALTMGNECWQSAMPFLESVRQNKSGFVLHYGQTLWEYYNTHQAAHDIYVRAQSDFTVWHAPRIVASFNFGKFKRIVDVGGGRACLSIEIAKQFPSVDVTVIDREDTAQIATGIIQQAGVSDRCRIIGGNFLEAVPAQADLYIIKHVLRDWPDVGAVQLLQSVRRAMHPRSQLMVIEGIAGVNGTEDQLMSLMDIQLFGDMGGGLRSHQAWTDLLRQGGFELKQVLPTEIPDGSLLMATPMD